MFDSGGKRIRPAITLLSANALWKTGKNEPVTFAATCEIVHAASLIYDDIIDKSVKRRSKKTLHLKWDTATAILAGNQLLSLAIKALTTDSQSKSVNFAKRVGMFADCWITLCDGKLLDVSSSLKKISDRQVLEIMYKKTAVLFELAAKTGAVYSDADLDTANSFANYGKNIGMAFQIQDDILGVFGNEKVIGKDVGSDIKEGKKTLLVSYVLNDGSSNDKKRLLRALGNNKMAKENLEDAKDLFLKNGAYDYAKSFARKFSNAAVEQLDNIENSQAKKYLKEIPSYVISRIK